MATQDDNTPEDEMNAAEGLETAFAAAEKESGIVTPPAEPIVPPAEGQPPVETIPPAEGVLPVIPPAEGQPPAGGAIPPVVPPVKTEAELAEEQRKKDEEIAALDLDKIAPPEGTSPRAAVNFDKVRASAKFWKDKAGKSDATIGELNKKIAEGATNVLTPELQKELDDLRGARRVLLAAKDPEFQKQFDGKLAEIDNDIIKILKSEGMTDELEKKMRELGVDGVSEAWWKEHLEKFPFLKRTQIERLIGDRAQTASKKQEEIESWSAKQEEFIQSEQTKVLENHKQFSDKIQTHVNLLTKDIPWANPIEIKDGMTPEQKAQAEKHNANLQIFEEQFQRALRPQSPEELAEVAASAVAFRKVTGDNVELTQQLSAKDVEIARLNKELEGIKSAGQLPDPGTGAGRKTSSEPPDLSKMSDTEAIAAGLEAAEAAH